MIFTLIFINKRNHARSIIRRKFTLNGKEELLEKKIKNLKEKLRKSKNILRIVKEKFFSNILKVSCLFGN